MILQRAGSLKKVNKIYIGSCGSYIQEKNWLQKYCDLGFKTIEINYTFYKMPDAKTLKRWYNITPKKFIFSIKCNIFFTHYKQFKKHTYEDKLIEFIKLLRTTLKEKFKFFLIQLPRNFKYNDNNISKIKHLNKILPFKKSIHYIFEFRDIKWLDDKNLNINFVRAYYFDIGFNKIYNDSNIQYIRLHGTIDMYSGSYRNKFKDITKILKKKKKFYIF